MKKYIVWWTYVSNFGDPKIVEANSVQAAIESYPTWYDPAKMTWNVCEVKAKSSIYCRVPVPAEEVA